MHLTEAQRITDEFMSLPREELGLLLLEFVKASLELRDEVLSSAGVVSPTTPTSGS